MKRFAAIMTLCLLCFITGCQRGNAPDVPVKFYYPNATISYGTEEGLLSYELREGLNKSAENSISEYLNGPKDNSFLNPFPKNTVLTKYELRDNTVFVTLSDSYATLTGLDLSIANTCLSMTVLELTGAVSVSIQCESALIDGHESIVLDRNSSLLYDSNKSTTPSESSPADTRN